MEYWKVEGWRDLEAGVGKVACMLIDGWDTVHSVGENKEQEQQQLPRQ